MSLQELYRLLINLLRQGVVEQVDLDNECCRVRTGELLTDWIKWLAPRAGDSRSWWAPTVGEQVLIGAIGGELTTGVVIGSLYSNANPAPTHSANALHLTFPDGAVIEYEPETGVLKAIGIKTANIEASEEISATTKKVICKATVEIKLDTPNVICTNNLTTATLNVKKGGEMTGDFNHNGGSITSNGVVIHTHQHSGVRSGGDTSGKPV
ncbi:phage baseplate assembly protein V [Providencia rettgeri]|uniref:Phage P2 baseplate assembly protein gpV n=1 Tax=Providencia rettgeri TaxID=587 RepID=A0A9N8D2N5_PRORE|nr:phage baseplate assembly protein V [Providencia rettgeri]CAB5681913.1 Phage P2 baseplate assembly protein gpV [Providencia rettgeri]CAB5714948.1 Phage P2 baseplate assembly protein gpV [Providencia rettgeri]CAC9207191.1 Phage P2 baseplate assembly protein gpV [Providencia rettgeri]CAC9283413.1 Phage P2 baseplate assembly protein gpV [Providencia rettgeri]